MMAVLAAATTVIYFLYFYSPGTTYATMLKIMKGLNSNTFNYLEQNAELLKVNESIPVKMDSVHNMPST